MENEKEMREAVESASFQMWQAYCNKKMECEDLQEQVETQAARIAELEAQVKQLQRVPLSGDKCVEIMRSLQHSMYLDPVSAVRAIEAAHNIK
jgi:DNA repair ATPase RecN